MLVALGVLYVHTFGREKGPYSCIYSTSVTALLRVVYLPQLEVQEDATCKETSVLSKDQCMLIISAVELTDVTICAL